MSANHSTRSKKSAGAAPLVAKKSTDKYESAFIATAKDRAALDATALVARTIDGETVLSVARGALPGLFAYRDALAKTLTDFDIGAFDKLDAFVDAGTYAQRAYATQPETVSVGSLYDEAVALRDKLRVHMAPFVHEGIIDGSTMGEIDYHPGYKKVASDLGNLCAIARRNLAAIEGKSILTGELIEHGLDVADRLGVMASMRDKQAAAVDGAAETRQRALTLVVRTYEATRTALGYLRRNEGDAASIAPSLYPNRGKKKTGSASSDSPAAPLPAPVAAPAPTPAPAPVAEPAAPVASPAVPVVSTPSALVVEMKKSA